MVGARTAAEFFCRVSLRVFGFFDLQQLHFLVETDLANLLLELEIGV
jgi:hypothetical protein